MMPSARVGHSLTGGGQADMSCKIEHMKEAMKVAYAHSTAHSRVRHHHGFFHILQDMSVTGLRKAYTATRYDTHRVTQV